MVAAEKRTSDRARWRRYRWPAGAAGVALAISAAGLPWWMSRSPEDLPRAKPAVVHGIGSLPRTEPYFSMGGFEIREPGKEVRILSVKALTSANVAKAHEYAVPPRLSAGPFLAGPGATVKEQPYQRPIEEVVTPAETAFRSDDMPEPAPLTVTLTFHLLSGVGAVNGVSIVYRADGELKRVHFPRAAIACVQPETCDAGDTDALLRRLGLLDERRL